MSLLSMSVFDAADVRSQNKYFFFYIVFCVRAHGNYQEILYYARLPSGPHANCFNVG